ncbi:hypothetical protein [Bosea sp. AAP35]|uniref:hypothetical protein n=1 Tax=Bosea sp. AAP35 TaxID=1523417 RepID=UPI0012E1627A|nr:hypothetical protein [Bosea sp. AAP35]
MTFKGRSVMTPKGRNQLASHDHPSSSGLDTELVTGARYPGRRETASWEATPREVAGYIEGLTASLRGMAQAAKLDSLAYFLEMARLEASIQRERPGHPGQENGSAQTR